MRIVSFVFVFIFCTPCFSKLAAQVDYSDMDHWLFHPEMPSSIIEDYSLDIAVIDAQLEVDSIIAVTNHAFTDTGVDVFWVHPTLTFGVDNTSLGNVELEDLSPFLTASIAAAQAGQLARYGRIFAPRYRQATAASFFLQGQDELQADILETAYLDVKAAFLHYLENHNDDNQIILAGHSQGAHMLSFLLRDVFDNDEELRERLVVAVLGGMGFIYAPKGEFVGGFYENIQFCTALDQRGCVMTWRTYKAGQSIPEAGFAVPATNPELVDRGYAFDLLDFDDFYSYSDSLYYGSEFSTLDKYLMPVSILSDLAPPGIRFVAFDDFYEARFDRQGPFAHGLAVSSIAEEDDQRPRDLETLETDPLFAQSGYHTKDYNVYTWALIQQINCKLGDCGLMTNTETARHNSEFLQIYPNPTPGKVALMSTTAMKSISIYNATGHKLRNIHLESSTFPLDLSDLSNGLYYIEIRTKSGMIKGEKLIVQNL